MGAPEGRSFRLRNRLRAWGEAAVEAGDWRHDKEFLAVLQRQQRAWALVRAKDPPMDWPSWIRDVSEGAGWVAGTGWRVVDPALVTEAEAAVEKWGGPPEAGAVLRSMAGLERRDWDLVAQATERLGHALAGGRNGFLPDCSWRWGWWPDCGRAESRMRSCSCRMSAPEAVWIPKGSGWGSCGPTWTGVSA